MNLGLQNYWSINKILLAIIASKRYIIITSYITTAFRREHVPKNNKRNGQNAPIENPNKPICLEYTFDT
jgi:hypothetical protein